MPNELTFKILSEAVTGTAAAFRCIAEYEPAGGPGDKVFPPTYEGGKYATENRRIDGELVPCVLLDSVQSQANRMELALLEAWEEKQFTLPVITVDFRACELPKPLRITSLEAPHRIADAILRDSLLGGKAFRKSKLGERLDHVSNKNATALFEICPTSLVFGLWDSTGPRGGLGAKFARAMVSEMVGFHAEVGKKTGSRVDPLGIILTAGPIFRSNDDGIPWTLDETKAVRDKKGPIKLGKDGKPSEANHGNVTPSWLNPKTKQNLPGGVTITKALQTTVLSLPALRRLRFPLDSSGRSTPAIDNAARIVLAALGLCAASLNQVGGCDLRSRCQLHPIKPFAWDLLDEPGTTPQSYKLPAANAVQLFKEAVTRAKSAGLPWMDQELVLTPSPQLTELVRRSQEKALQTADTEEAN